MTNLQRAIEIALRAHEGQTRWNGDIYITHPLRVMLNPILKTEDERIVAILHDVIEDCPEWSFERLRGEGFTEIHIDAIDSVTKRPDESYEDRTDRTLNNPIGRKVKLCDLYDNYSTNRKKKYEKAIKILEATL